MNTDWNELIQRYIAGHTTEEETRRLEAALKADDALADLYLRHTELDVALEAKASSAEVTRELLTAPVTGRRFAWLSWRPLAAAAACLALLLSSWLFSHFKSLRVQRDVAAAISSTQNAIAKMSVETPTPLPEWMSPTASALDQPHFPQ